MLFRRPALAALVLVVTALCGLGPVGADEIRLSALDLTKMRQAWGKPQIDRNIVEKPMAIAGESFKHGVGSHASSVLHVKLDGRASLFTAKVGVDDETQGRGTIKFLVYADGKKAFDSGIMKGRDKAKSVRIELEGIQGLVLLVTNGGDDISYDHANWALATFTYSGSAPEAAGPPAETAEILTPKAGPEPRINGPKVYGCRPGRPFIYRIPCTGRRPLKLAAENLPASLELDSTSGIITGSAPAERGEYPVKLFATNEHGRTERPFKIVVGDTLALTPPMGWNSWYIHYHRVSDEAMRAAADAMVESGMADFGYSYVNIDDCWMVKPGSDDPMLGGEPRDADGAVRPNKKFPDMFGLTEYIHSKGLKAGLYTSPGPLTCAGYVGSYQHEETDARKFAEWGFDFLKYDWCSYGRIAKDKSREELKRPYQQMGDILKKLDRDIVLNLCQYGMGEVWEWGGEVGGHCWRTTGDLGLVGGQLSLGIFQVGLKNATLWEHPRPGQWNDPDYILIGYVGSAHRQGEGKPTTLTPNEQYTHMSMWCLMAAPLVFSGDMTLLDDFTLNILCNAEVIEIDQDSLGKQAKPIRRTDDELVLSKPLEDGSLAVGLFNLSEVEQELSVTWKELGIGGARVVRDLWRQKDLGERETKLTFKVPRHGVRLLRVGDESPAADG